MVIDTVDAAVLDSSCPLVRPVRLVKLSTAPSHEEASPRSIYAMFFVVAPAMVGLARLTEERSWRASAWPGVSDERTGSLQEWPRAIRRASRC